MFKKYVFKKIKATILIILILSFGSGSLFLAPTQTHAIFMNPAEVLGVITDLNGGAEAAEVVIEIIINSIEEDGKIPEEYKTYIEDVIQNAENIDEYTKDLLLGKILNNEAIPEEFRSLLKDIINSNGDISGLIKNWVLDLLLKHVDIEHICKSLSDIAANIVIAGFSVGTPFAIAITQICPIILNQILQGFLETLPEPPAPTNIQTIQYPIFESYQWEIGIPGLVKPGEVTEF